MPLRFSPIAPLVFLFLAFSTFGHASEADNKLHHVGVDDVLHQRYADIVGGCLSKRQGVPSGQLYGYNVTLNDDGTINMEVWDQEVESACQKTLSKIQKATNPAGTCVCYNLPSIDTETGVFQADFRVYRKSAPSGIFANIAPEDILMSLEFNGASVSSLVDGTNNTEKNATRESTQTVTLSSLSLTPSPESAADDGLPLVKRFLIAGQIDGSMNSNAMSMSQLESVVIPVVTLSTAKSTGRSDSCNVSINEAIFIHGIFSTQVVMSTPAAAQVNIDRLLDGLNNGTVAFVLPGVRLMIFPIGLIVTSTWLFLGVAAYGFGTYERIKHAESFKRRRAFASSRGTVRI